MPVHANVVQDTAANAYARGFCFGRTMTWAHSLLESCVKPDHFITKLSIINYLVKKIKDNLCVEAVVMMAVDIFGSVFGKSDNLYMWAPSMAPTTPGNLTILKNTSWFLRISWRSRRNLIDWAQIRGEERHLKVVVIALETVDCKKSMSSPLHNCYIP